MLAVPVSIAIDEESLSRSIKYILVLQQRTLLEASSTALNTVLTGMSICSPIYILGYQSKFYLIQRLTPY